MNDTNQCSTPDCCGGASRRGFLKSVGLGVAVSMAPAGLASLAMAGPFEPGDFDKIVPADKKLSPDWVKSLFARGTRTVYRGAELEKIGMPIGGLCSGQLYLGGDGRLWHWDIFNIHHATGDANYAHPPKPASPFDQGFAIRTRIGDKTEVRRLDSTGFAQTEFCGGYPIGFVEYRDAASPITVSLEAFSPFIPLSTDDSSYPATVMRFTVKNSGKEQAEVELAGWLQNAALLTSPTGGWARHNKIAREARALLLNCSAAPANQNAAAAREPRADIPFENFEKPTYEGWTVTGTAFGEGPILKSQIPEYQGDVGGAGQRVVNSHNARAGGDVAKGDAHTGTLTSKTFTVERDYINLFIGGGKHPGQTCVNILVDGKVARTLTGHDNNRMRADSFDVRDLAGKQAQIQIVDNLAGPWGNIGVDEIVFSDKPTAAAAGNVESRPDFGTMTLALLDPAATDLAVTSIKAAPVTAAAPWLDGRADPAESPTDQKLTGALVRKLSLAPDQQATVTFVIAWHFANLSLDHLGAVGRHYATRFKSAADVALNLAENLPRLAQQTRLWHDTWYDSTLPYWFLDRTMANTSILATSTSFRFASGRFYGWEGVGCCAGTCTHVWHYAHSPARLFPDLERDLRRRTDYQIGFDPKSGVIQHRGEFGAGLAVDGQAGCILRVYREHQMSADDQFLKSLWPRVKKSLEFLIAEDRNADGILEGAQHNTLDAQWFGPVSWLSSLYIAALRAGSAMAREMGDDEFAKQAAAIADAGQKNILSLYNGEYFIQKRDPKHPEAIGSGVGCEIDQVFGQSWAYQVGLPRVLPETETRSALAALWKYNFAPDAGGYHKARRIGRWYAMPGEAGLLMCTFPRGGDKEAKGSGPDWATGYFNECMTGFEYQVAGHMVWEGMVTEGLAITRAIHDRYHAVRRNPWNEVECGDHYARAMASYGVFTAACGFENHGPDGHLGFAPRLTPDNFRAPFTAAEGWGTFEQKSADGSITAAVAVKFGNMKLQTLALSVPAGMKPAKIAGSVGATFKVDGNRILITLATPADLKAGQQLQVTIT